MHTFAAPLHRKHQHAHRLAEEDYWHEDTGAGDLPHCCQQVAQKHDKQVSSILDCNSEISEMKCNKHCNVDILSTLGLPSLRTREVVLPRFKLEQNYDLIENLKEMGITDIFQESGDFSGMTSEKVFMNWVRL